MAQFLRQANQNNLNPMDLFKQVTKGYNTEQMNNLMTQARNMGFPTDILEKIQSDINTK